MPWPTRPQAPAAAASSQLRPYFSGFVPDRTASTGPASNGRNSGLSSSTLTRTPRLPSIPCPTPRPQLHVPVAAKLSFGDLLKTRNALTETDKYHYADSSSPTTKQRPFTTTAAEGFVKFNYIDYEW